MYSLICMVIFRGSDFKEFLHIMLYDLSCVNQHITLINECNNKVISILENKIISIQDLGTRKM